jgi:signal transduction histidine kinase
MVDNAVSTARMQILARLARPTAHEVRGALSALHIHLELLAGALDTDDAAVRERRARHLAVLKEECGRLQQVTDAFIALASLADVDADVRTVVAGVVEAVRPLAITRQVRLEAAPVMQGTCRGSELEASRQRLLDVLVDILASATAGSAVRIEPGPRGRSVRVYGADGACVDVPLAASQGRDDG